MESSGVPGQVNISSSVYELVKDKYACTYRGKIFAKNVGDIDMYFVEGESGFAKMGTQADIIEQGNTGILLNEN